VTPAAPLRRRVLAVRLPRTRSFLREGGEKVLAIVAIHRILAAVPYG
jgi:hypothetical protein